MEKVKGERITDQPFFRLFIVFVFIFIANLFRQLHARKSIKNKIEMPSKIQRIGLVMMYVVTIVTGLLILVSALTQDVEMTIVSSILTLVFIILTYFTRRKFKRFYEETSDYFELKNEYWVFNVDYANIIDWVPLNKQIGVLDSTQEHDQYICVNLTFSDPEILLKKITEMTFAGEFSPIDERDYKQELIDFLKKMVMNTY